MISKIQKCIIASLLLTTTAYPMENTESFTDKAKELLKNPNLQTFAAIVAASAAGAAINYKANQSLHEMAKKDLHDMAKKDQKHVDPSELEFKPETSLKKFTDLAPNSVPRDITRLLYMLTHEKEMEERGIKLPLGVLLVGRPGVGKSILVHALAGESNCIYFKVAASIFTNVWQASGSTNIRKLFSTALSCAEDQKKKALIFVDEIDAIAGRSENSNRTEDTRTTLEFLKQFDLIKDTGKVIVFGATNNPKSLDNAVLRSGRFDWKIEIPMPSDAQQEVLLKFYLNKLPVLRRAPIQDPEITILAKLIDKDFSPADIDRLVAQANINALETPTLALEDLQDAIQDIINARTIENASYLKKTNQNNNNK